MSASNDEEQRSDFNEFCGIWSNADLEEFERETADLRSIDPDDWE